MDAYFKERPWYLGTVEPEAFSEEVFSSTERENIRLIREMENDPERMDRWYSGSDGTAPAPYMEILDRYPGRTSSLTGSVSAVSYTHLDVYKRQLGRIEDGMGHFV